MKPDRLLLLAVAIVVLFFVRRLGDRLPRRVAQVGVARHVLDLSLGLDPASTLSALANLGRATPEAAIALTYDD